MAAGTRNVVASTIFQPVATGVVTVSKETNASGTVPGSKPNRIGPGNYQVLVGGDIDPTQHSVTTNIKNVAGGVGRTVNTVFTRPVSPAASPTTVDIFVRVATTDALIDDAAAFVEVTISQLPL